MVANQAYNMYQKSQVYEGMDPKKLILILYNETLKRLNLAKEGILNNSPQKRGENIGRAIAIITELQSSIDSKVDTDEIRFLRGLYLSILIELPKVAITNDVKIIERTYRYIEGLRDIWEKNIMGIHTANHVNKEYLDKTIANGYSPKNRISSSLAV